MTRPTILSLLLATLTLAGCSLAPHEPAAPATAVAISPPAPAPWYEPEIAAFEAADAASPPAPGQVLFIGSSSIRMWKTLADDMAPAAVLNRGFGGSKTPEVLAVMDRIVYPYDPSAIVYYCGDNDLGETNTDSEAAADGFIEFAERVHGRWPTVPILYMSIKPSLARWSNWAAMERANALVADYADETPGVEYMDLATCLLGPSGAPQPTLYLDDGLHLSAEGYARWTKIVRARLEAAVPEAFERAKP